MLQATIVEILTRAETHVHNEDTGLVQLFYYFLGRHTDGTNKQFGFLFDDNVN